MQMAAGQQKKRLHAVSLAVRIPREQCKAKKKKMELPQYDPNMRSDITLEWDDKKSSVVAKSEQISISQRDLFPFVDVSHFHNTLADVFDVPRETFQLQNLKEVLSYEVWETHLSEKERKLLSQFLPRETETHKVVQQLLGGHNFHFGSPSLKWGASLCSGNLHPDAVLHQERSFKTNKKSYYSELQKYHQDMIGNLQILKERWASCKDPEKDIMPMIWRSTKHTEKRIPTHANESRLHDPDANLAATSESCSWAADENACSSDNPNMTMHGEPSKWICTEGFTECNYDNTSDGLKVVARPKKRAKLQKRNEYSGDGAKYMLCIKVSKEQYERVKSSMKHSNNSIKTRSLNHVLGNIDSFNVQSYDVFEQEERQKLHEYWLQLANRDIPAGFANWRRQRLQRWQLTKSLGQEIDEKLEFLKEEEKKECHDNMVPEQTNDGASNLQTNIVMEDIEEETSDILLQEQMDSGATDHEHAEVVALEDVENQSPDCISHQQKYNGAGSYEHAWEDENDSVCAPAENQHLQKIPFLGDRCEFRQVDLDSDDLHVMQRGDSYPSNMTEYPENLNCMDVPSMYPDNLNHMDVPANQGEHQSSATDVWPATMPGVYYHSTTSANHEYASASELSLGHPQVMEVQPAQLIDQESDMQEDGSRQGLHGHSNEDSFFSPYPSQTRNELFQSLLKNQSSLAYSTEQKQNALHFQSAANVMMDNAQFPVQFPPTQMDMRQNRLDDIYMHQNVQANMQHSDGGGRYLIHRHEHLPLPLIQDWAANNTIHMSSAPPQSHLNGEDLLLNENNWFSWDHRDRSAWRSPDTTVGPNQNILGNGSNADQSLFSMLSQFNGLRSGGPNYNSSVGGSSERFIRSGNYGGIGGGSPTMSNTLSQQTVNQLNYLGGHGAAAAELKTNSVGWMSLPHQNTALHDSVGKPYLRSWNH